HPGINDGAELGHFEERVGGDLVGGDVLLNGVELGLCLDVLHAVDAAEDFGEIDGLDGDAGALEEFFAVADGVEGGGTGSDGADAEAAEAAGDAADGGEGI